MDVLQANSVLTVQFNGHWVGVTSGGWRWTGRPGVLQSMELPRVGHDWAIELNWTLSTWRYHRLKSQSHQTAPTLLQMPIISSRSMNFNSIWLQSKFPMSFPYSSAGKESTCNVGDLGSILGLGRYPGEGKGLRTLIFRPIQSLGLQRVGHDWAAFTFIKMISLTNLQDLGLFHHLKKRSVKWIDTASKGILNSITGVVTLMNCVCMNSSECLA